MEGTMQKLTTMRELPQKDTNQVVEVEFQSGGKRYSYLGSGNLRTGQQINKAPVNHYISNKPYTAPVKVVATHNVYGAQVGEKLGVTNGNVHKIPTGLKYLPGTKELNEDRQVDIAGQKMSASDYMSRFDRSKMQKLNTMGEISGGTK